MEDKESLKRDRAWIEINLNNLENNINEIKKVISDTCDIMAIVKANAYGHGMINISKKLNSIGIRNFAVATLEEGITLRENNIDGNILILGYTDFSDLEYAIKYDLIQTIVDYEYASKINKLNLNNKLKAHIKINTGMNRIGESYKNVDNIAKIYEMKNIEVLGIYSHLCVADSIENDDVEFTNNQDNNFFECVNSIKNLGYYVGKIHLQASYCIFNYPNLKCDYVRPGIIMYGLYSDKFSKTKIQPNIKPVLSLKARISSVKQINAGDSVGYGRTYIADENRKIASVSIGYADGYPRSLSGKHTKVLINNEYAEIVGRICMDQLMIDVTNISNVKQGDIVTLIGEEKEISAEEISYKADTITNELLCRLGNRLPRIEIN